MRFIKNQHCFYSKRAFTDVFSETSKENLIKYLKNAKPFPFNKRKTKKEAGVLVPFCLVNDNPSVLVTVRSAKVSRNKGDVSFPGGIKEVTDKDAIYAALRETKEEIGITVGESEIWTTMYPLTDLTGRIIVTPVIAFLGSISIENCQMNKYEVEAVFAETLESLCNVNNWRYTQYKKRYTTPVYLGENYRIWGLTAGILHIILQGLLPEKYKNNLIIF